MLKKYFNGKDSKKKTKTFLKFVKLLTDGAGDAAESKKALAKSKEEKVAKAPEAKEKIQLFQRKSEKTSTSIKARNKLDSKQKHSQQLESSHKAQPTRRSRPTPQKSANKLNDLAQEPTDHEDTSANPHRSTHS